MHVTLEHNNLPWMHIQNQLNLFNIGNVILTLHAIVLCTFVAPILHTLQTMVENLLLIFSHSFLVNSNICSLYMSRDNVEDCHILLEFVL